MRFAKTTKLCVAANDRAYSNYLDFTKEDKWFLYLEGTVYLFLYQERYYLLSLYVKGDLHAYTNLSQRKLEQDSYFLESGIFMGTVNFNFNTMHRLEIL